MAMLLAFLCSVCVSADDPPATRAATGTVKVTITDLRNDKGNLVYGVFKTEDGFPTNEGKSRFWRVRRASDANRTFVCELPPGTYAASVLHDENANGAMDRGAFGIPREGYGVTNNPKPRLRQATFKEAAFELKEDGAVLTISLQYF
jgi:uncharacterized protein (DUF2141 family)